jgi:hypothetical protein
MLKYLLESHAELAKLAKLASIPLYGIQMLSYDNTVSNTDENNGLGVLFDLAR